ncbi:hypothetical protein FZW96_19230 [Bacillus sp. BGMRC 2118]|nr:hypothetical protein FZW96_19230 [Bacillus sp. BGMRC 2118]
MERSTWIWDVRVMENREAEVVNELIENKITTVYIFYSEELNQTMYKKFMTLAHSEDIKVEALGGERVWGLKKYEHEGLDFIQSVVSFNQEAGEEEKFDAIHLDIEPYLVEEWEKDKTKVLESWYQNSLSYISLSKENGIVINCDLPFWLDSNDVIEAQPQSLKKPLYELFIDAFDGVNLMSYRNTVEGENSITDLSNTELTYAEKEGKQVGIAVDLLPSDIDYTTFYHLTREDLEQSISMLHDYYRNHSSYNGVAIHDFEHLKQKR